VQLAAIELTLAIYRAAIQRKKYQRLKQSQYFRKIIWNHISSLQEPRKYHTASDVLVVSTRNSQNYKNKKITSGKNTSHQNNLIPNLMRRNLSQSKRKTGEKNRKNGGSSGVKWSKHTSSWVRISIKSSVKRENKRWILNKQRTLIALMAIRIIALPKKLTNLTPAALEIHPIQLKRILLEWVKVWQDSNNHYAETNSLGHFMKISKSSLQSWSGWILQINNSWRNAVKLKLQWRRI